MNLGTIHSKLNYNNAARNRLTCNAIATYLVFRPLVSMLLLLPESPHPRALVSRRLSPAERPVAQ